MRRGTLALATSLAIAFIAETAAQKGFFAPHYELLDPNTGRPIKQKLSVVSSSASRPSLGQLPLAPASVSSLKPNKAVGARAQREIELGFFSESDPFRTQAQDSGRKKKQFVLKFDQDNPRVEEVGSEEDYSNLFATFPVSVGSGDYNPRDEFVSTPFSSFGDVLLASAESPSSSSSSSLTSLPINEVPTSAGVLKEAEAVAFKDLPAYKKRKRYPFYGRRRRSADSELPAASTWVLLDPATGRVKSNLELDKALALEVEYQRHVQADDVDLLRPVDLRPVDLRPVVVPPADLRPVDEAVVVRAVDNHHKRYPYSG